jgi:hypothetical protein
MAQVKTALVIDENLMSEVREIAQRNYWTLTAATEIAFKMFVQRYKDQLPLFTPETTPEVEKAR